MDQTEPVRDPEPPIELSVDLLLRAYASGVFPMADTESGAVHWYRPDPRAVIPLAVEGDGVAAGTPVFRISRSLRQRVRSGRFRITTDLAFADVLRACARDGERDTGCWLTDELMRAYDDMHDAGYAHSIEAWLDGDGGPMLVGGLYGVLVGGLFAGESMFSAADAGGTDASKVCMVHLVDTLRRIGALVLDTQFYTEHLGRFGAIEVDGEDYLHAVDYAVRASCAWPAPGELAMPGIVGMAEPGG
ncbi:MAG: leucyl/phenylalanyl-tRNA--protein transferase [Planctomycetota bacterium]